MTPAHREATTLAEQLAKELADKIAPMIRHGVNRNSKVYCVTYGYCLEALLAARRAPKEGEMGERWITKGVDVQQLDQELNAFHLQGYTIRWLFENHKENWPDYLIIAERAPR